MSFRRALLTVGLVLAAGASTAASVETRALLEAPLLPEGADWNAPGTTLLANVGDPLVVDLGGTRPFRALLLQADGNDVYRLEASEDGAAWSTLWLVPRAYGLPGLRTRTLELPREEHARYLRVRATAGDGAFSVARLRLYESRPAAWPPVLDRSLGSAALPLFPLLHPVAIETLQGAIAALGVIAAAWCALRPARPRASRILLGLVALAAAAGWVNFGNFRFHGVAHTWEVYHYYVGAKYFPELGYEGLYACAAVAEAEDVGPAALAGHRVRDLVTNQIVFVDPIVAHPEVCRARFSPTRWAAFRSDVRFFREQLAAVWPDAQTDHGFNATPVWTVAGRAAASLLPATPRGLMALVALDFALLLLACGLVFAGFGFEAGCIAVVFFGTNAFARFAWTGGAFLRYDWLFLSVLGLWALRRERPVLAGFALVYAALLRVFPAVLLLGLALHVLGQLVRGRRSAWLRPAALGGALAVILLVPASLLATGRTSAWPEFVTNSRKYLGTEAANRLGLATALAYRPETRSELTSDPLRPDTDADWQAAQSRTLHDRRSVLIALEALFGLLALRAASRREPWAAAALGAGFLPILFRMANYYYALLVVGATLCVVQPALGVGLVALSWATHLAASLWPAYDERAVAFSVLACAYAFWAALRMARADRVTP